MLLVVDSGNTRVKWGLRERGAWKAAGVFEHARLADGAALCELWAGTHAAAYCNVAGATVESDLRAALAALGVTARRAISLPRQCGVENGYASPAQLGADRWAALIGARTLHAGAALVVCAGTATTVDLLDRYGIFRGGLILPGLELMLSSLARGTAQLPRAQGEVVALPRSTQDAIMSGCVAAQVGAIERMWAQISTPEDAVCLISGGARHYLARHLSLPVREVEHLVLEGLARIAEEQ
ncbi:MAG: type III pantothenate kinase [Rhodocyclaceae bacterium]|nr:type III pantothenate kinase [Rhodocyclaceae bacterium]MBX3667895.1 type III pantothenate kinase [Rhodocyclaceae bacterium]